VRRTHVSRRPAIEQPVCLRDTHRIVLLVNNLVRPLRQIEFDSDVRIANSNLTIGRGADRDILADPSGVQISK